MEMKEADRETIGKTENFYPKRKENSIGYVRLHILLYRMQMRIVTSTKNGFG